MNSLMNSITSAAKLVGGFTLLGFALVGCSQDGPMENFGESMDQTYEEAKESAQDNYNSAAEMGNDAMDSMENAVEETKYKARKMKDSASE